MSSFSPQAESIALALKNMLSIYKDNKLLRLYGFDSNVEQLVPVGEYFFVMLEDGNVIGCGHEEQVNFLEC